MRRAPHPEHPAQADLGPAPTQFAAAGALTLAVAGIVAVGFLGSYGPLRDAFLAIHQGKDAAARDPWAVDGLVAVAIASAIWLRHETAARRYALTVAALTTSASLLLNFLHGLGVIGPGGRTAEPLHPALVFTIASLPVAAIGFGSHLLVHCLRQLGASRRTGTPALAYAGTVAAEAEQDAVPQDDDIVLATDPRQDEEARPARTASSRRTRTTPRPPAPACAQDGQGPVTDEVPDPALVTKGRAALAGLLQDGVPPTRDTLRTRMGVGTGKASAVWAVLQHETAGSGDRRVVLANGDRPGAD